MFSNATIEAIGSYVYALADYDDRIFYVGKGEGNRVFDHIEEVRRLLISDPLGLLEVSEDQDDSFDRPSQKRHVIAKLLRGNIEPRKYIIREGLTSDQALLIEAVLISVLDWQLGGRLTNLVAGHGTANFGLKTVEDLEATKGEPFSIADLPGLTNSDEVVAINVNRRWPEVVEKKSTLLDISKGCWKINKERADRCRYAIIHANGVVRGVFEIKRWIGPDVDGRFTFEPVDTSPIFGSSFSQRNASSLFGPLSSGSQNPIRYVRLHPNSLSTSK